MCVATIFPLLSLKCCLICVSIFIWQTSRSIYFLCLTIKVIMFSVAPPVDNSLVKQDCFSLIRRLSKSITFADSHGCRSMTCFVVVLVAKKKFTRLHNRAHFSLKLTILHSNGRTTLIPDQDRTITILCCSKMFRQNLIIYIIIRHSMLWNEKLNN